MRVCDKCGVAEGAGGVTLHEMSATFSPARTHLASPGPALPAFDLCTGCVLRLEDVFQEWLKVKPGGPNDPS